MILGDGLLIKRLREIFPKDYPLTPGQVQPCSIDLTLGNDIIVPTPGFICLKPWDKAYMRDYDPNALEHLLDPDSDLFDTYPLDPGDFLLATTAEHVEVPRDLCGEVWGKSSLARLGVQIHVTAGLIDPGFCGNITLEVVNQSKQTIYLKAGMKIAQIVFKEVKGCRTGYTGKYQNQVGTTKSGGVT